MKEKGEVNEGIIILTEEGSMAKMGQVVGTYSEHHLTKVDLNMDKISEEEQRKYQDQQQVDSNRNK